MSEEKKEPTLSEIEANELNLLIKRGVKFDITYKVRKRRPGIKGFFQRKADVTITETFEIQEPTLSVLDRLSELWLQIAIDEDGLKAGGTNTLIEAKNIAHEHNRRAARIVAIAVLGEDYHVTEISASGRKKTYNDDKELDRLTELFHRTIKPSKLEGIANTVTAMANLGDFIGSMRLMTGARTTQPRKKGIE